MTISLMQMNLSSSKIQSLRTCNKSQKTSMLFAGSRSMTFKSCIMRSKLTICCETRSKTCYWVTGRLFLISALAALRKSDWFDCQCVWSQVTDIVYSSSQDGKGDSQGACRPVH
jgi:hypothetical protein